MKRLNVPSRSVLWPISMSPGGEEHRERKAVLDGMGSRCRPPRSAVPVLFGHSPPNTGSAPADGNCAASGTQRRELSQCHPPFYTEGMQPSAICPISANDLLLELNLVGWVALDERSRGVAALNFAQSIGTPLLSPTGVLVRELVPKESSEAVLGTFSHAYGKASFPLHTDTAFWPTPARYLVMRVAGDTRRPTVVAPLPQPLDTAVASDIAASVWIARGVRPFYCSMKFQANGKTGVRYDPLTMQPANAAAARVMSGFRHWFDDTKVISVDWAITGTLIIDNWRVLHGRGAQPPEEGRRVLERIYVG